MSKLILFAMIMISPFASTGTLKYRIKMKLSKAGQTIFSPTFITHNGETASITQNNGHLEHRIQVVANESTFNGESIIHLKLKIEAIDSNGQRTLLAQPEILAHENQMAEMTTGSEEQNNDINLQVLAERTL